MDERHAWSVARFALRALLVTAGAVVALVIGASTAQADDAPPAGRAAVDPVDAPSSPVVPPTSGEPAEARPVERVLTTATATVAATGETLPALAPVTGPLVHAVDDTAGEPARQIDRVLDGAVRTVGDVADEVIGDVEAPGLPSPTGHGAHSPGAPSSGTADSPRGQDRRPPAAGPAAVAPEAPSALAPVPRTFAPGSPASIAVEAPRTPDLPVPTTILDLGAISGAPSTGSGVAGGPVLAGMLPYAATAPAVALVGMTTGADDERLFALPLTPGWSPD